MTSHVHVLDAETHADAFILTHEDAAYASDLGMVGQDMPILTCHRPCDPSAFTVLPD